MNIKYYVPAAVLVFFPSLFEVHRQFIINERVHVLLRQSE